MYEPKPEQLPQNIEAEQALLGALLANNKSFEKVSEILSPEYFSNPVHAQIYEIISKLISKGHVADVITLKNYFEQSNTLDEVGGFKYLIKLADSATPLTPAEYYAQFIYDKYLRRELINIGCDIATSAAKEDVDSEAEQQIENAEKKLFDLADKGETSKGFINFSQALSSSVNSIESAYQRGGKISGLSTGLDDLDAKIGGLNDSDLLIIAGRPGMGKTALGTNIAYNVATDMAIDKNIKPQKKGVAFFSLEMSSDQLASRILSTEAQISGYNMRIGKISTDDFSKIAEAANRVQELPLYIDDTPGLNINAIRTRARRLKRSHGLGLIVIDYIQLITGTGSKKSEGNRVQEVSEISRGLKILAKELQVPVIALSQLNRSVESRDDKKPQMSDLRESGSIEQDADIVMFVFRENYYLKNNEPVRRETETEEKFQQRLDHWKERCKETEFSAEVIVGKNRHGTTGSVKLFWNGDYTYFGNSTKPENLPYQRGA